LEQERIRQRDSLVEGFVKRELTGVKSAVGSSNKVNTVKELLSFHEEQSGESDKLLLINLKECDKLAVELSEANEALASLRRNEREKSSGRSRDVSILFNAPSDDQVLLRLT
jgi:hypothetical protein